MKIFGFIILVFMLSGCNWMQYHYSIEYHYGDWPSKDLNGTFVDSLLLAANAQFSITNENTFYNNDVFKKYYYAEYRLKDEVVEVKLSPEYTQRVWTSYWKISDLNYYEECNKSGRLKRNRPSNRFETEDVTVLGLDSIIESKDYWISKKDTFQSGFANKEIFRNGNLKESWSGYCSWNKNPCDWTNIRQCTVDRYKYHTKDSIQFYTFKCDSLQTPINFTSIEISRDQLGRELTRNRELTIFRDSSMIKYNSKYFYSHSGYVEKYEWYINDSLDSRTTVNQL